MYEDDQYDNAMYERDTERIEEWVLYSEGALDTLCLCGLRNRLSHGTLEAKRCYDALDGASITLHRPICNDKVEDITQSDLDILRAVVTDYVFTRSYDADKASLPWPEDDELLLTITPSRVRSLLRLNRNNLPTSQITLAFQRLAGLIVQGKYRVRTGAVATAFPIHGSLFELGIDSSDSGKRVQEYVLYFGSEWGRAFLHNVRCGNFVVVRDIPYQDMDSGAKQLFYIAMVMLHKKLIRGRDKLLQLMNIKEKQNAPRSIKRLETYLNQLQEMRLIQWRQDDRKYVIQRIYNPVEGIMPELTGSGQEQLPAPKQEQDEAWELQFGRVLPKLEQKSHRSAYENIQHQICRDAGKMQEK